MRPQLQVKSEIRATANECADLSDKIKAGLLPLGEAKKVMAQLDAKMAGLQDEHRSNEAWELKRAGYLSVAGGMADENPNWRPDHANAPAISTKQLGAQLAPIGLSEVAVKSLYDAMRSSQPISVKAAGDVTDLGGAPGLQPQRLAPIGTIHEPTRVAAFIPGRAVTSPVVEYVEITGSEAPAGVGALVVAAGALKPAVHLLSAVKQTTVTKIAALIKLLDESMADFGSFLGIVSQELNRVVIDAENGQLLNGLGTVGSIKGLNTYVAGDGVIVRPKAADTPLDALEQAVLDMRNGASYCAAELFVMNPLDWSKTRRTKDSQGRYLFGDPTSSDAHQLWGLPVVVTSAQPAGKALVLAPSIGLELFVRESLNIRSGYVNDDFQKNLTSLVCEERLALAVLRPSTIVQVTGL